MRIISGKLKGRRFDLPSSKWKIRPTTDQAKESLFNILVNKINISDIEVLDLFAGTGNIAYEFASLGAAVVCVEKYGSAIRFIRQKSIEFGIDSQMDIHKMDVFRFLSSYTQKYDLIFADPPYHMPTYSKMIELILAQKLLKPKAWLVLEHDAKQQFEQLPYFVEYRQYGQSFFSFFQYQ